MTQITVAPQSMPVIASSSTQNTAAPGTVGDFAERAEAGVDFAAVLKKQINQPAKDATGTENIAALPFQAAEADEETAPADVLPVAPDLAALLPALAALMPPARTVTPVDPGKQTVEPVVAAVDDSPVTANPALLAQVDTEAQAGEEAFPSPRQPARQAIGLSAQPMRAETDATLIAADPQMSVAAAEHANPTTAAPAVASLAHTAPSGTAATSVVHVGTPVGNRGWDAEVGQKIVLLVNRQESRAELTLTPPQLGKLEITISVNGDQTSATFVSASPAAREALEQALPRLREMLAEAGISLGQANVNAESAQRGQDESATDGRGVGHGTNTARGAEASTQWVRRSSGLIDTFA
ncbi:MAG: flagellar hook-length control protein FliK [Rhodocyclaceae bacterium]|nr:flagellar hook-length control protein FliK [Rhodocyclaceae bacterium]